MILVGHSESTDMSDELYHSSLSDICKNQVEIGALADKDNFISVGYVYNPEQLSLSKSQQTAIKDWIHNKNPKD